MNATDHEQLKDIIRDIVGQSHQSIAAVQSNSVADIKTTLAVINNKVDGINEHLAQLNGKSLRNANNIEELKLSEKEIKSTLTGGKWVGTIAVSVILILIGTISSLALYVYANDKEVLASDTKEVALKADVLSKELKAYQDTAQEKQKQIIELLRTISKQQ